MILLILSLFKRKLYKRSYIGLYNNKVILYKYEKSSLKVCLSRHIFYVDLGLS